MANLFIEGFDQYPTGTLGLTQTGVPWLRTGTNTSISVSSTNPITGLNSLEYSTASSPSGEWFRAFSPTTNEVYFGAAVIITATGASVANNYFGVRGTLEDFGIFVNSSHLVVARRGSSTIETATTHPLSTGVKHYLEARVTGTTYEARVDGVVVASGSMTNIGTINGACIRKGSAVPGLNLRIDDMYYNDTSGTINNGYLGEINVVSLFPDADETPQDWVPSTGSTAWGILDNSPNTTDYVEGQNAGDKLTVSFPGIGFSVTDIHVVQTAVRLNKSAAGANENVVTVHNGSGSASGSPVSPAEATYAYFYTTLDVDPDTGLPWDESTFDPRLEIERTV